MKALAQCLPSSCVLPFLWAPLPWEARARDADRGALCREPGSIAVVQWPSALSERHLLLKQNGDVTCRVIKTGAAGYMTHLLKQTSV